MSEKTKSTVSEKAASRRKFLAGAAELSAHKEALGHLTLPLKTLIVTLIMVPAMVYFAMPFATSHLKRWL